MSSPDILHDPENVHEQDLIDEQKDVEERKDAGSFTSKEEEWNKDNLPPHSNDELFKEKHNL